jgi:hypothetical protein
MKTTSSVVSASRNEKDVASWQVREAVFFGFGELVPQKLLVEHCRLICDGLDRSGGPKAGNDLAGYIMSLGNWQDATSHNIDDICVTAAWRVEVFPG